MSLTERDVVLRGRDADGNGTIDLPVTRLGNIEDGADIKDEPGNEDYIPVMDGADGGKMKKTSVKALLGGSDALARVTALEKQVNGRETLTGEADPTGETAGTDGQFYLNLLTGDRWECHVSAEGAVTWEKLEDSGEASLGGGFAAGTAAPANTKALWIDTTPGTGGLKYHNGTAWVHVPVAWAEETAEAGEGGDGA